MTPATEAGALDSRSSEESVRKPAASTEDEKVVDVVSLRNAEGGYKLAFPHINERKLLWKMDLRVVSLIFIMNFFTFLDRVNISNAALFGLKQDLKLVGNQYNDILLIYFIPYALFDIPSNMLMKRFKPHVWLTLCMFGFGFVTITEGLTHNFGGILTARFFLGVFETAMFPGCLYLISMWYKREEAQKRFTFFFGSNNLAGSFSGLLGYAIGHMDGMRGYRGWRWIFILEGTLSCVMAIGMYFLVSDFPEEATWLSADEKAYVKARLEEDQGASGRSEKVSKKHFVHLFKDIKSYAAAIMYLALIVPAYGYVFFAPTIIQGYGHSAIQTQLFTIPPYAVSFVFGMIISTISDRLRHRFTFAILGMVIGIIGFAVNFKIHDHTNVQYGALFLASAGTYTAMPLVLCWYAMNVQGHAQRSVSAGFQVGVGNIGGIIASYAFLAKDAPKYVRGYSVCVAFECLAVVMCVLYRLGIALDVRKQKEAQRKAAAEGRALGPDSEFVYVT